MEVRTDEMLHASVPLTPSRSTLAVEYEPQMAHLGCVRYAEPPLEIDAVQVVRRHDDAFERRKQHRPVVVPELKHVVCAHPIPLERIAGKGQSSQAHAARHLFCLSQLYIQ